jgi:hypothetical protein
MPATVYTRIWIANSDTQIGFHNFSDVTPFIETERETKIENLNMKRTQCFFIKARY